MVLAENSGYCGSKIEAVDLGQQASWRFQLAVDERRVQDQPCGIVGDLRLPPQFNLALQGLEIPLDSVHAYRERINQVEALGVLGQDRREIAAECHIGATKTRRPAVSPRRMDLYWEIQ